MLYLVFDIEAGLAIEKELKTLNISIHSSVHQKGGTKLWATQSINSKIR